MSNNSSRAVSVAPYLSFHYSNEFERERIEDTFKKARWFVDHGYTVRLPGNEYLSRDNLDTLSLEKTLLLSSHEFDRSLYAKAQQQIEGQWSWFQENWPEENILSANLSFSETYNVFLTSYGVAGSYDLPDTIIVNVKIRDMSRAGTILFHELIHLAIESLIQKYRIPHWEKERLVDLFYKRILPSRSFEQNLPREALLVDPIFEAHYGNIEDIIKTLAQRTQTA